MARIAVAEVILDQLQVAAAVGREEIALWDGATVSIADSLVGGADPTEVFAALAPTGRGGLLADNGGPVQTVALRPESANPALDAAGTVAPITDTRGAPRVDLPQAPNDPGLADLGAFELQALPGSDDPSTTPTPGDDLLIGTPGPDVIDGLEGDDRIEGLGQDDVLTGGPSDRNTFVFRGLFGDNVVTDFDVNGNARGAVRHPGGPDRRRPANARDGRGASRRPRIARSTRSVRRPHR